VQFFSDPLFRISGNYVTAAGLAAFALFFASGLLLAKLFQSDAFRRLLTRLKLGKNFVSIIATVLSLVALIFFSITAINAAGVPLAWSQPLPGISLTLVQIFLLVVLLLAVFWISARTKTFLFNRFLVNSGLERSLQYAISQIISNIVLVVGVFIVLDNTGIHLGTLAVFAGAVGVGVGFGLQNIASNFISGLVILAERPITIGDRVEVAGIVGQVQQIRARSTVILTNDNIAMIVPNTKFIDSPVTNWTYGDPRVRFRIPVSIPYGSNLDEVCEALLQIAHGNSNVLAEPKPNVFLNKFGESSIDFELVVWSQEMNNRPRRFRSDLNFAIAKKFKERGIEIPYPQRDLHFRSGTVRVQVATPDSAGEQVEKNPTGA
jgi:small-conductance mechanosensitive channel